MTIPAPEVFEALDKKVIDTACMRAHGEVLDRGDRVDPDRRSTQCP